MSHCVKREEHEIGKTSQATTFQRNLKITKYIMLSKIKSIMLKHKWINIDTKCRREEHYSELTKEVQKNLSNLLRTYPLDVEGKAPECCERRVLQCSWEYSYWLCICCRECCVWHSVTKRRRTPPTLDGGNSEPNRTIASLRSPHALHYPDPTVLFGSEHWTHTDDVPEI